MSLAASTTLTSGGRVPRRADVAGDSGLDDSTPGAVENTVPDSTMEGGEKNAKAKKRSLFGFGKKKDDSKLRPQPDASDTPYVASQASKASTATSRTAKSPARAPTGEHVVFVHPSSPTRALSSSPRVSSPASSQIFERDVQDSTALGSSSPAIPTHIQTENYIPPVLDDASEAITNDKLDPDAVEIVTHTSHQPASVTVTGASGAATSPLDQMASAEWAAELASFANRVGLPPDSASNYGSLDSADVRRLSFISFADVVQAEHSNPVGTMSSPDSVHMVGLTSIPSATMNQSTSPIRSPVSSQGQGTSPPTSNPGSMKGIELSPPRKPMGSPKPGQNLAAPGGDLNIETMRQALRRTGSTDLSSFRSNPTSPI